MYNEPTVNGTYISEQTEAYCMFDTYRFHRLHRYVVLSQQRRLENLKGVHAPTRR